jgi:hypothetical protein
MPHRFFTMFFVTTALVALAAVAPIAGAGTHAVARQDSPAHWVSVTDEQGVHVDRAGRRDHLYHQRELEALYLPVERRVLRRLDELAQFYGSGADGPVEIPLTQEEVAGLAGTSRASVNAVLGDAQISGLVALRRGKITIVDPAGLAARAGKPPAH